MGVIADATIDDPLPVPLPNPDSFVSAGKFGATVVKAARFAGLDEESIGVFQAAANLSERHGCGYGPQDGDVGQLTAALGVWLAALRERAQAA